MSMVGNGRNATNISNSRFRRITMESSHAVRRKIKW